MGTGHCDQTRMPEMSSTNLSWPPRMGFSMSGLVWVSPLIIPEGLPAHEQRTVSGLLAERTTYSYLPSGGSPENSSACYRWLSSHCNTTVGMLRHQGPVCTDSYLRHMYRLHCLYHVLMQLLGLCCNRTSGNPSQSSSIPANKKFSDETCMVELVPQRMLSCDCSQHRSCYVLRVLGEHGHAITPVHRPPPEPGENCEALPTSAHVSEVPCSSSTGGSDFPHSTPCMHWTPSRAGFGHFGHYLIPQKFQEIKTTKEQPCSQ